jgi:hypothetical protein
MGLQLGHQNYKNMKRLHPSLDSEDVSPDLLASSQRTEALDDVARKWRNLFGRLTYSERPIQYRLD